MKRASLVIILLIGLGILARPRDARACGDGGSNLVVAATGLGAVYVAGMVTFAGYDLIADDPSPTYGRWEAALHAPVAVGFAAAAISELSADSVLGDASTFFGGLAIAHAALAAHGIHTAVKKRPARRRDGRPPPPPGALGLGRVRANVVPSAVSDGASLGAGLGLVGRF